jgi:uncharacterized phage-associated protein
MFDDTALERPDQQQGGRYAQEVTLSAHEVAAEIRRRMPGIGVKKLHKLLYYCQGRHLADFDRPLFRESVSAWDMGPVIGKLWYEEKRGQSPPHQEGLDEGALNTVGYVLSRYGRLTARDLEHMTHGESPWQEANQGRPAGESALIRPEELAAYFRSENDSDDESLLLDDETIRHFLDGAIERRSQSLPFDTAAGIRARTLGDG